MSDTQTTPPRHESGVESEDTGSEIEVEAVPEESSETESGAKEAAPLPLDQVFDVLRNERRRRAIRFLVENGGQVEMSELAENLAAWETDKPVAELTSSERKRVYVALYQCHLPRMDDMDVVEFNKPRGVIETGPNATALDRYLAGAEELRTVRPWRDDTDSVEVHDGTDGDHATATGTDRPWPLYYGALVLTGALLYPVSLLFAGAASVAVVAGLLLALGGCSVLHFHEVTSEPWHPWASGD